MIYRCNGTWNARNLSSVDSNNIFFVFTGSMLPCQCLATGCWSAEAAVPSETCRTFTSSTWVGVPSVSLWTSFFFCVHQEVAVLVFSKNHYGCIHNPSVAFCVVYIHHSVIEHEPLIWSDSVKSNSVFKHLWLGVRPITPGCLHIDFGHWSSNP